MSRPTRRAGNGSGVIRWRPSEAACAAGLQTIELARQHGGQGLSFSCKLRAFEEIAKQDFAFAFALINHHNAVARFARDGQPAHVARLLPRMIAGEVIGCAGLSEPGVGSDFGALEMSAAKVDGGWKLNGAKAWITNAAVAGLSVVYAQTDKAQGYRGIACFAIEAERPGFHRDKPFEPARWSRDRRRRLPAGRLPGARRSPAAPSRPSLQVGAGRHQRSAHLCRRDVLRHVAGVAWKPRCATRSSARLSAGRC